MGGGACGAPAKPPALGGKYGLNQSGTAAGAGGGPWPAVPPWLGCKYGSNQSGTAGPGAGGRGRGRASTHVVALPVRALDVGERRSDKGEGRACPGRRNCHLVHREDGSQHRKEKDVDQREAIRHR
eukprot:CAMPEP_0177392748 /NCGR_PEP_ID=MMETSP0368-20130122/54562_1 /TAXON_ID=447022 ORGANISM="Scrippsiella hangoei-like, Strain SHHI-4" /NCGR_SAMPLE_ID=MMETSP0368 /ASSEMBLY_ACC=CAM_ASM_000363 /LENGTH=125 /DNA_ID=CAMNT_0018858843 /DNA_START=76 /DNA_END=449 /DNA_ORIENTATION=-